MRQVVLFCGRSVPKSRIYLRVIEAVELQGKLVTPRPCTDVIRRMVKRSSGIVLCGGGDINPRFFNPMAEAHPSVTGVDDQRDLLEREAVLLALKMDLPVLAICRGAQVLNWALGGEIYQDINDQYPPSGVDKMHSQHLRGIPRYVATHEVILSEGSLIHKIFGKDRILVNSTHHQAIRTAAPGTVITGRAPDGIPEVLEVPGARFIVGVQFHPERLWQADHSFGVLFRAFSRAARFGV